ncbi:MAG: ABC transporter ATP-binding protein, partial [Bacteroidota bacterium]
WVIGSLSWPVLVVLLVGVGISAWHTLHFSPKLSERRRKTLAVNYPLVGRMLELIGGLLTVKSLSATVQVTGDVKGLVSEKEGCEYEEALYSAGMNFASSTIRDLTLVAAIATAFALLLGGQLALSDLFAIYVLAGGFVGPAGQVVSIYRTISVTAANLRNYYEVIDIESESPADAAQAGQPAGRVPAVAAVSGDGYAGDGMAQASVPTLALADDRPVGEIEFDQLTFGYADDTKVIDNLSLTVEPGERIALIGRSGAGKTTLIRLLLGFLEPQAGSIRVDGLDLKDYRNKDLFRQRFGVVGQDALLFNVSVRENLLFGLTEPREDEEIREVLDLVNLLDHVEGLSNGLDTVFTSDEFSGGQRQRLAVARALIRRPDIVLLDEPTSALDFENEREVVNALDRLVRGKTTITIAHRLSTVQDADRVVVLDQGQVVAAGPHAVLYETNDYYRSMCEYNSFIV